MFKQIKIMNLREIAILGTLAIGMFACGGSEPAAETETTETTETTEAVETVEKMSYTVNAGDSKVMWSGGTAGAMVYGHSGLVSISDGSLEAEGTSITGGSITIDMTTINPTDSAYTEENTPEKLVGHLASGDFFMVDSFPTASFTIKSMEGNTITGDLTVRGKTNEEKVTDVMVEEIEGGLKASGKLVFDRQKYDVAWAHFMQDVVLSDEITLDIELNAAK